MGKTLQSENTTGFVVLPTLAVSCQVDTEYVMSVGDYVQPLHSDHTASADDTVGISVTVESPNKTDNPRPQTNAIALPTVNGDLDSFDLLLDTEASVPVIKNAALLHNIRPAPDPVQVDGIGGQLTIDTVGDLDDFGTAYHHPEALANVLSFASVEDQGTITYVQRESCFRVKINGHTYVFRRIARGSGKNLYACNMRQYARGRFGVVCVQTVAANEALYTKREIGDAQRARDLSRLLGFPSLQSLVKMVKSMEQPPVTIADVYRAARIWGPDVSYLKGTTRNQKTQHIDAELLPLKEERAEQVLHVDLMYVEGEAFLISKSTPAELIMAHHLGHGKGARTSATIKARLEEQFASYQAAGYKIRTLLTDNEGGVAANRAMIEQRGIAVNPTSAGKHVPVVENCIKTVKSRVRTHIHALPFRLCRVLLTWLVLYCVSRINMEPSNVNVDGLCPREKFTRRGINFKRDLRAAFGDYVQVQVPLEETNGMEARTEGAIAVFPTGNLQGSVKFYLLRTNRIVTRDQWVPLPMPQLVIDHLNNLAGKNPVSGDPTFAVGERAIEDADRVRVEPPAQEHICDGPVRVVPNHNDITEPSSEPAIEAPPASVVPAATDNSESLMPEQSVVPVRDENPEGSLEAPTIGESPDADPGVPTRAEEPCVSTHGYNTRHRTRPDYAKMHTGKASVPERHYGLHITVSKALQKLGRRALKSMVEELHQFDEKSVGIPVRKHDLSHKQLKAVIRSSMFLKEKFLSTGEFEKLKARLVAGGHMQDKSLYEDLSSPTVATTAVFMIAAIAAKENRKAVTLDIGGAYLNASMGEHEVHMRLEPLMASILSRLAPAKYSDFVCEDGSLIVRLNKALYGCVQSARLWYNHLSGTLKSMGFECNPLDKCVFNKVVDGAQCTMCLHVDDLLITCESDAIIESVFGQLQQRYKEVKIQRGPRVSYLGMTLDFSRAGVTKCTMEGYIEDVLELYGVKGKATSPAAENLFEEDSTPPLNETRREEFHSFVAKLLYLAKRVRPDLLVSVSYLATRVQCATEKDSQKLERVFKYLNATRDLGLRLEVGDKISVLGYIDASYGVHRDGKSHTGAAITLGGGVVYAKSAKQKIVTKSSTEAEIVGLSDSSSQVIWSRDFLIGQGYQLDAAVIYQDNMSTIALVKKGQSTSERSRHINIRYFFVKDRVDQGDIKVEYKPTGDMLADVLTKPLQGSLFAKMRDQLLNCYVV